MSPVDFSLDSAKINLKDVIYILPVLWFCFQLYVRLTALESGVLEGRIASLNMELSYMEQKPRSPTEDRVYELKKALVAKLMVDLEDAQ